MNFGNIKFRGAAFLGLSAACLNFGYSQIDSDELAGIIDALRGDDFAARYDARMQLQDHVSVASEPGKDALAAAVELQLLELLADADLPVSGRLWLLRQLNSIGGEASVDALAELLRDDLDELADAARMALEMNASARSTSMLIAAVGDPMVKDQVGVIDSLGQKGNEAAIEVLSGQFSAADQSIARASMAAVSEIGGSGAENALAAQLPKATPQLREDLEIALVAVSEDWAQCELLAREGSNDGIKLAALQKCIEMNPRKSAAIVRDLLASGDLPVKEAVVRAALLSKKAVVAKAAVLGLGEMDLAEQSALAGALASAKKSSKSEKLVLSLLDTDSETLKLQAVEALGSIGSAASMDSLMEAIDSKSREMREAATYALGKVKDSKIDRELIALAKKAELEERLNAIAVLAYRNSPGAIALLNEFAANETVTDIREASLETLENIGDASSFQVLIDLILEEGEKGGLRRDAQKAIKRMSLRIGDPAAAWAAFERGFEAAKEDSEAYEALLAVVDSAPTQEAIAFLKEAWVKGDAATRKTVLRVLSVWRNWDGGALLLDLAKSESSSDEDVAACYKSIGRLILGAS
ncbi:MAG: HEAT repeat domain-containing protein, partial [Verrucomicrobiota bacterium]